MRRTDVDRVVDEHVAIDAAKGVVGKPYVNVTLVGPCAKGKRCPEVRGRMLVDTGAVNTYIEPSVVKELGLRSKGRAIAYGIGGPGQVLSKYPVTLTFPGTDLPDVPQLKEGAFARASKQKGRIGSFGINVLAGGEGAQGMRLEFDAASGEFELRPSRARKRRTGGEKKRRRR